MRSEPDSLLNADNSYFLKYPVCGLDHTGRGLVPDGVIHFTQGASSPPDKSSKRITVTLSSNDVCCVWRQGESVRVCWEAVCVYKTTKIKVHQVTEDQGTNSRSATICSGKFELRRWGSVLCTSVLEPGTCTWNLYSYLGPGTCSVCYSIQYPVHTLKLSSVHHQLLLIRVQT